MLRLDLIQVQDRLLQIAVTVDEICERHHIPMYMIAGTMLGAIRHKGFIPWDDDMDFAIPYEHYEELKRILNSELPVNLRCVSYDMSDNYKVPWLKVEDISTLNVDLSLDLPKEKMPGLTIDIFPLVRCNKSTCIPIVKKIQRLMSTQRLLFSKPMGKMVKIKSLVKCLFKSFFSYDSTRINDRIISLMNSISPDNYCIIPVDPNYHNRFFPIEWFLPLKKYPFNDAHEFYGVIDYDKYLTSVYRDYMKLPPEEKRRVHCDSVYLK